MEQTESNLGRRHVLTGLATAGVGVPLLAACGSSAATPSTTVQPSTQAPVTANPSSNGGAAETALAKASAVPVGGGLIVSQAVITQPAAGEFKAFSPVCTHKQCTVTEVTNGEIVCPCHGSTFSIKDGSVLNGPATTPLAPIDVTNKNGEIYAS